MAIALKNIQLLLMSPFVVSRGYTKIKSSDNALLINQLKINLQ